MELRWGGGGTPAAALAARPVNLRGSGTEGLSKGAGVGTLEGAGVAGEAALDAGLVPAPLTAG